MSYVLKSALVTSLEDGLVVVSILHFPVIVKPSYALPGNHRIAHDRKEFIEILKHGLEISPLYECLIEGGEIVPETREEFDKQFPHSMEEVFDEN